MGQQCGLGSGGVLSQARRPGVFSCTRFNKIQVRVGGLPLVDVQQLQGWVSGLAPARSSKAFSPAVGPPGRHPQFSRGGTRALLHKGLGPSSQQERWAGGCPWGLLSGPWSSAWCVAGGGHWDMQPRAALVGRGTALRTDAAPTFSSHGRVEARATPTLPRPPSGFLCHHMTSSSHTPPPCHPP